MASPNQGSPGPHCGRSCRFRVRPGRPRHPNSSKRPPGRGEAGARGNAPKTRAAAGLFRTPASACPLANAGPTAMAWPLGYSRRFRSLPAALQATNREPSPVPALPSSVVTLPSNALASLAMLFAVCLWSSATPTTKLAVQEIAVGEFVAVRLVLAAITLWLIVHRDGGQCAPSRRRRLAAAGHGHARARSRDLGRLARIDHDLAGERIGVLESDAADHAGAGLPGARRAPGNRRSCGGADSLCSHHRVGVGPKPARRRQLDRRSVCGGRGARRCGQCADRPAYRASRRQSAGHVVLAADLRLHGGDAAGVLHPDDGRARGTGQPAGAQRAGLSGPGGLRRRLYPVELRLAAFAGWQEWACSAAWSVRSVPPCQRCSLAPR